MLDINGKIPPHTKCPWKGECQVVEYGNCHHTGTQHAVAYSCAIARGFSLVDEIRNKNKPLQLNLI